MYSSCGLIWSDLFAIAKHMLRGIDVPVVLASVLDTCPDVAVSLLVHFCELRLLFRGPIGWRHQIFGTLALVRLDSKFKLLAALSDGLWPVVVAAHGTTERLCNIAGVLSLLDVIEFISHAIEILRLNDDLH